MKIFEYIFVRLFVHKYFYRLFNFLYRISLKGTGYLNYEDMYVSGELFALNQIQNKKDPIIFDVGASENFDYVEEIIKKCPEAEIYAFEPNPDSYNNLVKNNSKKKVHYYKLGLGEKSKKVKLYDYSHSAGTQHASLYKDIFKEVHQNKPQSRTISISTLDQFVSKSKIKKPIDFLKIDTEGSELSVLLGAPNLIKKKKIKMIQFEFNVMNVYSRVFLRDYLDLLEGYNLYKLLPDGMVPLRPYNPASSEIFNFHNILAVLKH